MLEWAQPLDGIKDHSNTPAETTNAYDADYKKRCIIRGANYNHSKQLKWLNNCLVNLNVDLELARNEASHERVTALEIEIDAMKADKNVLESQTEEQRVDAYALEEAQRVVKIANRDSKCAEKEAEEAQRVAKAAVKAAKWLAEVDASIESMIDGGVSFAKIALKLGNGLSTNDIKHRWYDHLKESSSITKPPVQPGFPSSITWAADVDASIMRMRADDVSFDKIASILGNSLKRDDIKNRWNCHLKDKLQ